LGSSNVVRVVPARILAVAVAAISLGAAEGSGLTPAVTPASKCVSHAGLPDLRCTPGALNPHVRQSNIRRTVCVSGWTQTIRPSTSYTNRLKAKGLEDYGFKDPTLGHYEEDHLIPLSVGGSARSPKNLWPEPYKGAFGARIKDKLERLMHDRVCDGTVRLAKARRHFRHWKSAFGEFF
jgi:hypothetical protein